MKDLKAIIGLEIHVTLNTHTKLFSRASQKPCAKPNTRVGYFDGGIPGAFPLLNKSALEKALTFGLFTRSTLCKTLQFDQKMFFFPDNPKGFQITQYHHPLFTHGFFFSKSQKKNFALEKIILEEDLASLSSLPGKTGIDYNTSGDAILEITTSKELLTIHEVILFLEDLSKTLEILEISRSPFRWDLNVSLNAHPPAPYFVEIKNLRALSCCAKALDQGLCFLEKLQENLDNCYAFTAIYDLAQHAIVKTIPKIPQEQYLYCQDPTLSATFFDKKLVDPVEKKLEKLRKVLF